VTSHKRRTTSKSGGSAKSPKTATSSRTESSSQTAPASFDQVFGRRSSEATHKLIQTLAVNRRRLEQLQGQPVPTVALYRLRHKQRIGRLRKYLVDIEEAIRHQQMLDESNN